MSFVVASTEFLGPFDSSSMLKSAPGIFVLLQEINQSFTLIDIGFASDLRSELINSDTQDFLLSLVEGRLYVGVKYIDDQSQVGSTLENLQSWCDTTNSFLVVANVA